MKSRNYLRRQSLRNHIHVSRTAWVDDSLEITSAGRAYGTDDSVQNDLDIESRNYLRRQSLRNRRIIAVLAKSTLFTMGKTVSCKGT